MRRIGASVVFAGFVLAACGPSGSDRGDPSMRIDSATAAVVNGEPVFLSDVELEAAAQGLIEPGDAFDREHPEFQTVLDQLIDQRLLAQEALRRRLDRDPTARHRLDAARERILGNVLVENLVASEVDEEAVRQMYAEQVRLQQLDDEVRVRHIVVETQGEASQVRGKIDAGEDFSALAFGHSTDRVTRIEGGEIGFVRPNTLEGPFATAIADTPVGSVSEPFETEQGWHILKVEERRQRAPMTLEEMRPQIITYLTLQGVADVLKRLRAEGEIIEGAPAAVQAPPPDAPDLDAAELDQTADDAAPAGPSEDAASSGDAVADDPDGAL